MQSNEKTGPDTPTGTESGQNLVAKAGKTQVAYWKTKLKKRRFKKRLRNGRTVTVEIPEWQVRFKHAGKEGWFNLHTENLDTAASEARKIFLFLVGNGWDATNAKFKPKPNEHPDSPTLGDFFKAVQKDSPLKPRTVGSYCRKFRTIVAAISGLGGLKAQKFSRNQNARWRERIDQTELAEITPKKIEQWRREVIARAGNDQKKTRHAEHSADSAIRCARALFGKKVLPFLDDFPLPTPLPFAGVPVKQLRNPYRSTIEPRELMQAAMAELRPFEPEAFKIFLLCLMVGLRRNEADKLKWSSIYWGEKPTVTVEAHESFTGKNDGSEATVGIDPKVLELLRPFKPDDASEFVIKSPNKPKPGAQYSHYRADKHFRTLITWLRKNGVNAQCPVHTLRKECGRLVTESRGIYAAQKQLRHRDVTTTARYYADDRRATYPAFPDVPPCPQTNPPTPEHRPSDSRSDLGTDTAGEVASPAPIVAGSEASVQAA